VITKTGYFVPDKNAPADPRQQSMFDIAEAARSTVLFAALEMTIESLVRHLDLGTLDFTVVVKPKNIGWQAADGERSTPNLMVAAVSLSSRRDILASRFGTSDDLG